MYETFIGKPQDIALREMEDFNKTVNSIVSMRQNLLQLQFQHKNDARLLHEAASMVLPQTMATMQTAISMLPRLKDRVGISQLNVLATEAMNIYDWESAQVFVGRAVAIKDAPATMRSEARRYQARVYFLTGKIQDGRKYFEQALEAISGIPGFGIDGARAYIFADWLISEYALGDCSVGNERARDFISAVSAQRLTVQARAGLIASLLGQLSNLQSQASSRCPIPKELVSLAAP